MTSSLLTRRRRRPEINIVPLIDISVKLIFFFLVSMQFREAATMNLTLPRVETAGRSELQNLLVITVTADGGFFVQDRAVGDEELRARVAALGGEGGRDLTVLIRSDQRTPVQRVLTAMDICRGHGLNRIRLQTQ